MGIYKKLYNFYKTSYVILTSSNISIAYYRSVVQMIS